MELSVGAYCNSRVFYCTSGLTSACNEKSFTLRNASAMGPSLNSDSTVLSIRSEFREGRFLRQSKSDPYRTDIRSSSEIGPSLNSDFTVFGIRSDFREGRFLRQSESDLYANDIRRSSENDFRVPDFQHPYPKARLNPLAAQCHDISNDWIVSLGIDKELGPSMWQSCMAAKFSKLIGYIYDDIEHKDFLWLCKILTLFFAFDSKMDDGELADRIDFSCDVILDMNLIILWNDPDNERLLEGLKSILDTLMETEASRKRAQLHTIHADLVHARNKSKTLLDVNFGAFMSGFRELWLDYIEDLPVECISRQAEIFQQYTGGFFSEQIARMKGTNISLSDCIRVRRLTGGVMPFLVFSDRMIEHKRRKSPISHLPDSLFYGEDMQNMLAACTDIIGWHNDIFGFQKELLNNDHKNTLVYIVFHEYNCQSYTQAGELVLELLQDRIVEMELAYERLRSAATPEFHPAIDLFIKTCRDWIPGTHEYHITSSRYVVSNSSFSDTGNLKS
uniref:Terpene synthase n=1 Tax=Marchantia polymorpha TaxID=3197 RepID=A0A1L5YKT3_MARPO|nr:terpene synthase-like protein [Marchantia polymorpha]